ncbi:MAG: DUF885 family protein, partial [Calditrichia bacterium]|nr:DUF885 family protein [Calditrichia bacterium]
MKFMAIFILCIAIFTSCNTKKQSNKAFEKLATNYINSLLEISPEFATYLGNHDYDNRVNDYSLKGIQAELKFNRSYLDSLSTIKTKDLSQNNLIDYKIMKFNIKSTIFSLDTLRS